MRALVEILAGWPFAAWLALAIAVRELRAGRRRQALNEAVHELRRPLHALALADGPAAPGSRALASAVELAAAALVRLEREINGEGPAGRAPRPVAMRPLVEAAQERWQARAALDGGDLRLEWHTAAAIVEGDATALAQALDNLILNAIEHGGGQVDLRGTRRRGRLRLAVVDRGAGRAAGVVGPRPLALAGGLARGRPRGRRGHGLAVVRRIAAEHGGRFVLRSCGAGAIAILELPLLDPERAA